MDAKECIKSRRSVRRFTDRVITHEEFEQLIDLAKMAPTWKNTQTLRYVFVQDEAKIQEIASTAMLGFEYNVKTVSQCKNLVVLTQKNCICGYERDGSFSTSKEKGWEMFDAGIAAQTFCLAANEAGFGTVILGIFDDAKVAEIIGLPDNMTVAALIPVGEPKFAPDPTPRKETGELVSYI